MNHDDPKNRVFFKQAILKALMIGVGGFETLLLQNCTLFNLRIRMKVKYIMKHVGSSSV